jgi:hypothetical protein
MTSDSFSLILKQILCIVISIFTNAIYRIMNYNKSLFKLKF